MATAETVTTVIEDSNPLIQFEPVPLPLSEQYGFPFPDGWIRRYASGATFSNHTTTTGVGPAAKASLAFEGSQIDMYWTTGFTSCANILVILDGVATQIACQPRQPTFSDDGIGYNVLAYSSGPIAMAPHTIDVRIDIASYPGSDPRSNCFDLDRFVIQAPQQTAQQPISPAAPARTTEMASKSIGSASEASPAAITSSSLLPRPSASIAVPSSILAPVPPSARSSSLLPASYATGLAAPSTASPATTGSPVLLIVAIAVGAVLCAVGLPTFACLVVRRRRRRAASSLQSDSPQLFDDYEAASRYSMTSIKEPARASPPYGPSMTPDGKATTIPHTVSDTHVTTDKATIFESPIARYNDTATLTAPVTAVEVMLTGSETDSRRTATVSATEETSDASWLGRRTGTSISSGASLPSWSRLAAGGVWGRRPF